MQRVESAAAGIVAVAKARLLDGGHQRPSAGAEIDREIGAVVREVVCIGPTTIPDREENAVGTGRALADPVDEGLACAGVPAVGGVAAIGGEVRAVHVLQGSNVV